MPETEHLRSLNLQFNKADCRDNVAENYRIIASSQGFRAEDVICVRQEHTDRIIAVDRALAEDRPPFILDETADALVTNINGVLLSVRTADCVPILLYDGAVRAIGAAHSGWRGTFMQIAAKTTRRMADLYGANPADVRASIGPAIGVCCYEVDFGFYEQFRKEYGASIEAFFQIRPGKKPFCDLSAMNKSFLIEAGVPEKNICVSELCTMCNPKLFYSHRRSGFHRGTMAAFIGMR